MSEQDRIFMKNFALLIAGLMVFTVVIIIVVLNLNKQTTRPENPDLVAQTEARLEPPGDVYVGEAGAAAIQAAEAASSESAATQAAFEGSLDGQLIYNNVCMACHQAGVAGAPKLVAAAWETRLEQGMDTLVQHAIEGYQGDSGFMPPKGGRADLSDEQMRATVQWMVDNLE